MKTFVALLLLALFTQTFAVYRVCYSTGDPHYYTFFRSRFDNMYQGTFLLAKTDNFVVHAKTGVWNRRTSVNLATGILYRGKRFVFKGHYNNRVWVNGHAKVLRHGRNYVNGLVVDKYGSRVIARCGREWVQVQTNYNPAWRRFGQVLYQNIAIYGNAHRAGICGNRGVHTARGIFNHVVRKRVIAVGKCLRTHLAHARRHCSRRFRGHKGTQFHWCVYDVCMGLRAKWAANWARLLRYYRNVITKYNHLRKRHANLANQYLRKANHHLRKFHIHSAKYRAHARAVRAHERARDANKRAANHHLHHIRVHKHHAKRHHNHHKRFYNLYLRFRALSAHWGRLVRNLRKKINYCQNQIRLNRRKLGNAYNKFRYYSGKASHFYNAANAHARARNAHNRAAHWHAGRYNLFKKRANAHNKWVKYHKNMKDKHEELRDDHKDQHDLHREKHNSHRRAANYWAGRVRNLAHKLRSLIARREAQRRTQVRVEKAIVYKQRSRACKTVPKYLDNVKFSTPAAARAHALRVCRHHNRNVFYSCVYDHSVGLFNTKREYIHLANLVHQNRRRYTCYSWGDPHNKPFLGGAFNVYRQRGWRNILVSGGLHIRGYLDYTPTWGVRSVNRYLEVRQGNSYSLFRPHGHAILRNAHWHVYNRRGYKEYIRNIGGYYIRVTWHPSRSGGYNSVWITTNLGKVRNCRGYCCNRNTNGVRTNRRLRGGNPYAVRFASKCARKTRSFRECAHAYRFVRNYHHKRNLIVRCVASKRFK